MDRTEKFIFYADTVLNCIPIVNTINSGLQALYKVAHRVDSVSPVTSGFRTSLKIHVLSKSDFEYLIGATPILGNFYALAKLGLALCCGIREYYLDKALEQENVEVVHLYLQTHSIGGAEWGGIFRRAMESSNLLFEKVFYSRGDDWDAQFLINEGISRYTHAIGTQDEALYLENTKTILSYWEEPKNIDTESIFLVLELFLETRNEELAARAIALLPEALYLDHAVEVLLKFSSQAVNGLMQGLRDSLIQKIQASSPGAFLAYHNRVMGEFLRGQINGAERDFSLEILNELWERIGSVAIEQDIQEAAKSGQLEFLKWMAEREGLSLSAKEEILRALLPIRDDRSVGGRLELFTAYSKKWAEEGVDASFFRSLQDSIQDLEQDRSSSSSWRSFSRTSTNDLYSPFKQALDPLKPNRKSFSEGRY